jgi:hypothetical protein
MKKYNTLEEQIFDIIKEKSKAQCSIGANHLAKLCHIIGFRTSLDEVVDILGKMMHEEKIVCNDFRGEEYFKIA